MKKNQKLEGERTCKEAADEEVHLKGKPVQKDIRDELIRLLPMTEALLFWYDREKRALPFRENREAYRVWVSEIMLQQTRVETVIPYYHRFLKRFPTIWSVAEAAEGELLKLWEGLGYYSRVKNMKKAAEVLCRDHNGELPTDFEALLRLPGFGEYTAGAVASIAFSIPVPAVDGNVKRVMLRLLADRRAAGQADRDLKVILGELIDKERPGDFNQALMELGATLCLSGGEVKCERCPLLSLCRAREEGCVKEIPVKALRRRRKIEKRTVLIIRTEVGVLLRKRTEKGLLSGLFELPGLPGFATEEEAAAAAAAWGAFPEKLFPLAFCRHIFTHIEWEMCGYRMESPPFQPPEGFLFANREETLEKYAIPGAFSAYRESLFP